MYLYDLVHSSEVYTDATNGMLIKELKLVSNEGVLSCVPCLTPMNWPSRLVPPEYAITGILYRLAILTTSATSSVLSAKTYKKERQWYLQW